MGWLLLEAGLALFIGLFIVWWTWPRTAARGGNSDHAVKEGVTDVKQSSRPNG
ncbi:MAG: hypothetical protein JNL33_04080 [Betaproteobacteria bacterium]|nr:hypothetical protein [Betaproteobacteria bacterium]MBL8533013.1 hypothetical protein [Betaproteobacteria bacterium]